MIRYLLDGRSLQDGSAVRGIGTYLRGLLTGFEAEGRVDDVGLLLERGAVLPDAVSRDGFAAHPARLRPLNRHVRPLLDPFQIGGALWRQPPVLYHAIEYGQPILPMVPVVVTIHDLVPFVMPSEYPWMRRERALPMRQFRRAEAVIAVSQSTAADAQRIAGVDPGRITVIPEGVRMAVPLPEAQLNDVRRSLRLPARFVLAVSTFDPRKRIDLLTNVVRRLRANHDIGLVIAGFQGNFAPAVDTAITTAGIGDVTRVLGHVSDAELAALYQTTECLLFTSSYEGFGLPALEAMAAGAAVAVFDNSSLPEVVGGAGLVVPDGDAVAMAEAVSGLLSDPRERRRRAAMGRERAAGFGWDRAARATLAVYAAVLDRR
jgi:alpha-1,3-rhamnosyl/mannosyltransferase